jgi:hypothetical protein
MVGFNDTALLPLFLLKIRSVRMLDSGHDRMFGGISFNGLAVLSGESGLGRLYTHPGRWIHDHSSALSWPLTLAIMKQQR